MNHTENSKPPTHWTTLEEYRGEPEVMQLKGEEFFEKPKRYFDELDVARQSGQRPGAAAEAAGFVELAVLENGGSSSAFSRRDFLKLSAAAMAFATAGCALRPTEKIIPYVKAPEEVIPGVANFYASTLGDAAGTGILIKTREGRPIKIEGNPDHPLSQGKLSVQGQLSIFNLYDPDRLQGPVKLTSDSGLDAASITWPTADDEIAKALKSTQGRIVLLTGTLHGPARMRLISEFCQAFGARHVMYDAQNFDDTQTAQEKCYGMGVVPRYRFDRAEFFLFLGTDPLGTGFANLEWSVDFGKTRKVRDGKMSKAVTFEPFMSLTGSNSDERFKVRTANLPKIALAIANDLVSHGHLPPLPDKPNGKPGETVDPQPIRDALARYSGKKVESDTGLPEGTIARIAKELWQNREHGLVMGGENAALQIAVNLINSICGNDGRAIDGTMSPSRQARGSLKDMFSLIADMRSGKVDTLIFWGTNPAFTLPESAGFGEAMKKVKTVVSLGDRVDESARLGHYVLPGLHYLESWGDAEPQFGLYSLTQPTIYPIYDNRAAEDSLLSFAKTADAGTLGKFNGGWHDYVMETWKSQIWGTGRYEGSFDYFWKSALRDGMVNTVIETGGEPRKFKPDSMASVKPSANVPPELELVVYPSPILRDGRDNNNAWMLECPDPISKVSWTNLAGMSPATAQKLGLKEGDYVTVEAGGNSVELPAHIQPGDLDGIISIQSGWGRRAAGKVGNEVGADAFALCTVEGGRLLTSGIACTVKPTGRSERMPCVQGHNYLEGRPIVADASIDEYRTDPHAGHPHKHEIFSMWPEHPYDGNRWGMSIDLSSCIGCNACIVACQVENNIPVVGREQIVKGREMHWIRVDRYYSGEPDNPEVTFQPMLCQHCENAPCETVCPVVATVHNEEGLNQQIYNRCVGTRYCSNNCPYKVRRFNWHEFAFAAYEEHPLELVLNPEVTVREKGVMEKCTFCVHRIRHGKMAAKQMGREVTDADIVTACQQTCPTGAITFGNINNPDSQVALNMKDERSFRVLDMLNVKPSIAYWTKLRNRPPRETGDHHDGEGHHA